MQGKASTPRRRYALQKVRRGDYLLLSNDAREIWRIYDYSDGPSFGLDHRVFPADFTRWGLKRWLGPVAANRYVNTEDELLWEPVAEDFDTRAQAIDDALARSAAKLTTDGPTRR